MLFKGSKSSIYIKGNVENSTPLFFFHGFTGSSGSWENIRNLIQSKSYAIDLPGHGKSRFKYLNEIYTINDFCSEFYLLLNSLNINKINLCGYSLGGRLALSFAYSYPEKINSLILESTSYGIENIDERESRLENDLALSESIKSNYEKFVFKWNNLDLFKNQKKRNIKDWELQNSIRLDHNNEHLAKSLESFSQGKMHYLGKEIHTLNFPIYLISGEEDDKYFKIAYKSMQINKNVKHIKVVKSGHNTHLENPDFFVEVIDQLL
tara:strand:+ start:64 stop:858 length:795 start_codon:yes stop_codon:yes gene_type:complete